MLNITSLSEFQRTLQEHAKVVVHFWAGWCEPCKLLDTVLKQLGDDAPSVTCVRVEAEEASDVSEHCGVAVVPLFAFYSGGKEVDRLEGAEPATLTQKFLALANGPTSEAAPASNAAAPPAVANGTMPVQERLKALVKQAPIMLFMKGNPDAPRCGFSGRVVEALRAAGADNFGHFDILTDEAVRQGLKEYSNWPTYPQLYVNGELMGGCDIVLEMAESGELRGAIDDMLATN